MKELQEIARAWDVLRQQGQTAALATVVRVDGSAYRRPGARMLVGRGGETVGSVSGGCLEADVVERARRVMETGEKIVVDYDTNDDGESVFGVGLGCQGVVRILIESLSAESDSALALPASLLPDRQTGVLATVHGRRDGTETAIGDRLLLTTDASSSVIGTSLQREAERVLKTRLSASRTVPMNGGQAEVFFEYLQPPLPLVIFGAGPDAQPLVRFAKELGWHVTVTDRRPTFAMPARFPQADAVWVSSRGGLPQALHLDARTAVVVMTHNYQLDQSLLAELLPSPVCYLGVLGPKRRTERLLAELREESRAITDVMLARLHSPIGLDIGAETPEQIALAIVAEIQARAAGRRGGSLRERPGSIYDSAEEEAPRASANGERPPCPISA